MTATEPTVVLSADTPQLRAASWLQSFSDALATRSRSALQALFEPQAGWRDLVAFTWNLRQSHDREAIIDLLLATNEEINAADFRIDESRPVPSELPAADGDLPAIEMFFRFGTATGEGDGYVVLAADPDRPEMLRARTLMTRLVSLKDAPAVWPPSGRFDVQNPGLRWSEHCRRRNEFADRDPEVLIVGGGQFGVMTAAHLARLGVDALIVDKDPRIGDAWRKRYESLFLHQPHNMLHFSMMPFPESFPEYLPKDKMAQWFESYVASFDLNFWTSTEFVGAGYDQARGEWKAELKLADGSTRVMRPKHLLMATGGSNIPMIPDLPGLQDFSGATLHATEFRDGADFAGKNVLVIGTGTSAHDFALDIVQSGGSATMVQRGPLIVIDLPTANTLYADYLDRDQQTELVDIRFLAGAVFHQERQGFIEFQKFADEADRELHDGLAKAGLKVWSGEDSTGFYYSYLSKSKGGYYLNVGASNAIVRGDIGILQLENIERFDATGIILDDGSRREYDVVIFATAQEPHIKGIERLFGAEFAEKLGPIWGFDNDGEMRNVLKPTAHEGFWILDGSIPMARWHSPLMALLVKAELIGAIPAAFKEPGHLSRTPAEPTAALEVEVRARKAPVAT
ncbi:monooxygenase [Mycolicibacterium litorale]|uniref:Monooxygenase n=1 Tax=Mycolicibacterium litorale TaxID=758802 RepID=A0A6S6PDX2_9MYCO|nr:monooxygenase [Mycolicibacterium litorale]